MNPVLAAGTCLIMCANKNDISSHDQENRADIESRETKIHVENNLTFNLFSGNRIDGDVLLRLAPYLLLLGILGAGAIIRLCG